MSPVNCNNEVNSDEPAAASSNESLQSKLAQSQKEETIIRNLLHRISSTEVDSAVLTQLHQKILAFLNITDEITKKLQENNNEMKATILQLKNDFGHKVYRSQLKANATLKEVKRGCILTTDQISRLSSDKIYTLLKNDKFEQAFHELNESDVELNLIKGEPDEPNEHAAKYVDSIDSLIEENSNAYTEVERTVKDLEKEAKHRNIKFNASEFKNSSPDASKPIFDGSYFPNVYQFIKAIDSYCELKNILYEHSGEFIKGCLRGEAKRTMDLQFHNQFHPDPSKIRTALKKFYGDKQTILKHIEYRHASLEPIPSRDKNLNYKLTMEHINLLHSAIALQEEEGPSSESLHYRSYLIKLLEILPEYLQTEYENNYVNLEETQRLSLMLRYFDRLKNLAFTHLQIKMEDDTLKIKHHEDETKTDCNNSKPEYRYEEIKRENCFLCEHLSQSYEINATSKLHAQAKTEKGSKVSPETCPHVCHLDINQKAKLYNRYKVCKVCLIQPINTQHQEEACNYTTKFPKSKCRNEDCNFRYIACNQHTAENYDILSRRSRLNRTRGVNLNV